MKKDLKTRRFLAILEKGHTGESIIEELREDKGVVLEIVKIYGWAFKYASEELRADKRVVLKAVENYGGALKYASEELLAKEKSVFSSL